MGVGREMIGNMRRYVTEYLARFPDFIAAKAVRQYHNYKSFDKPGFFVGGWSETVTTVPSTNAGIEQAHTQPKPLTSPAVHTTDKLAPEKSAALCPSVNSAA